MYRRSVVLRSAEEVRRILLMLPAEIERAKDVPEPSRALLLDQVRTTLDQFERQLANGAAARLVADRTFEGDSYRVTISVRYGGQGLLERIARLFGAR